MKAFSFVLISSFFLTQMTSAQTASPLFQNDSYRILHDRVEQGAYVARALSPTRIESNYQSPANAFQSAELVFKFAINGRDNEMPPGVDHKFVVPQGGKNVETPLITFGTALNAGAEKPGFLPPNTPVRIRLDFRKQKKMLDEQGYLETWNGQRISKADFKGVFIAGGSSPLLWEFDNLDRKKEFQLQDPDGDGIYEITVIFNVYQETKNLASSWSPKNDLSPYPEVHSPWLLSDALYNLALDEMVTAIEPDSTFRTGKEWAGVWTRDISYSIILAMAVLQPDVAKISLKKKVRNKRVIQDTGTGGAWPCSTDRMIWAVAAWEIYKVTGDKEWLAYASEVVKNSVEDDRQVAWDSKTGLMKGESSFLDWREQTYPRWMEPADIYESKTLGTNAVHFQCLKSLSGMMLEMGDLPASQKYNIWAEDLKKAINQQLWLADKKYYSQYLYGRLFPLLSPRAEALGEALCVWFGIADPERAREVLKNTPVGDFGIPCIAPQIPGIPPYHNQAVWPFVQSYWALAAAKVGHETSLMQSLAAVYRQAALFVTNKENLVLGNGDFAGTVINSSNMLWSLSGNIALQYRILFGMQFERDGLRFQPVVPQALAGKRTLNRFRYRKAILNVEVEGAGSEMEWVRIDGQLAKEAFLPINLTGTHTVQIKLRTGNQVLTQTGKGAEVVSPETPVLKGKDGKLTWNAIAGVEGYQVIRNGKPLQRVRETELQVLEEGEYQVLSFQAGIFSFASNPVFVDGKQAVLIKRKLASEGKSYTEISQDLNRKLLLTAEVPEDGLYEVSFLYANGNGPINTENKCALRQLYLAAKQVGTFVFPQRGIGEWENLGMSNPVLVNLKKGKQDFHLQFDPSNENMNGAINEARLFEFRLRLIRP